MHRQLSADTVVFGNGAPSTSILHCIERPWPNALDSVCFIQSPQHWDGQGSGGYLPLYLVTVEWGLSLKWYKLGNNFWAVPYRWIPNTYIHRSLWLMSVKHMKTSGLPATIPMISWGMVHSVVCFWGIFILPLSSGEARRPFWLLLFSLPTLPASLALSCRGDWLPFVVLWENKVLANCTASVLR